MNDFNVNEKDNLNKKKKLSAAVLVICIICILTGMVINYYTPGRVATVSIVATGEKNAASLGNNVRVSLITADRGTDIEDVIDFGEVTLNGDWNIDEENHLLTCYNVTQESEATFQLRDAENLSIEFASELGSGTAEIYINGELAENIDLYSDTEWTSITKDYGLTYFKSDLFKWGSIFFVFIGLAGIVLVFAFNYKNIKLKFKKLRFKEYVNALNGGIFISLMFVIVFTALQQPVFNNLYMKNAELTINATAEKSGRALADNVRITNIIVNGANYDLSEISLKDGWEYDGINHMIYAYNLTKPSEISIPLENVRTIEIEYVEEVGSGIFDVGINGKTVDRVDAYKNCKWESDRALYKTNPLIVPYSSYGTLALLFIAAFLISCVINKKSEKAKVVFKFIKFININIAFSFVLYVFISFIQRESFIDTFIWIRNYSDNFFDGFTVIVLLNLILGMILNKNYRSFLILSVVFAVLLTVSYFKIQFRDVPLLPWDFTLIGVAASVVSRFKLIPSFGFIFMLILFAAVIAAVVILVKKLSKNNGIGTISRIGTIAVSVFLITTFFRTSLLNAGVNLFEANEYYLDKGFVTAFSESMQYLIPLEVPENYNEENMQVIYNNINSLSEKEDTVKPNIIVIMSESFWDITRVKELGFDEEIFPTYRELQKTSVTGELLTNVYNGGTVNSEFEMLTGFSVAYLPSEYMPYQMCMRPGFFSINSYLKSKGYESLAIHPFEKTNYNRSTAYEYMEFDKTLWEEDFDEDTDRMRGYISDHALTEKIISEYEKHKQESNSPWFNLSVSMQNHGGYWENLLDADKAFPINDISFKESTQGSIEDLATGLHYADLALGELIDYFKTVDEPTVIIMFGDHMSNAGPIGETLLDQSGLLGGENDNLSEAGKDVQGKTEHSILEQRRVPFMAWSNYENVQKDCGIISVTQLLPTVFSEYDIAMPKYFEYLKNSQEIYPACASNIFIDNEGNCKFVSDMNEEEKKQYSENWLIEYDYIFGENYLEELFDY